MLKRVQIYNKAVWLGIWGRLPECPWPYKHYSGLLVIHLAMGRLELLLYKQQNLHYLCPSSCTLVKIVSFVMFKNLPIYHTIFKLSDIITAACG